MQTNNRRTRGFTLIELVMVIVIIAALSAIIIPNYIDYAGRSGIASTKANLSVLRTAIQNYRSENSGSPPSGLADLVSAGFLPVVPAEGITNSNDTATNDGAGGWNYNSGTGAVLPDLSGNDSEGQAFNTY